MPKQEVIVKYEIDFYHKDNVFCFNTVKQFMDADINKHDIEKLSFMWQAENGKIGCFTCPTPITGITQLKKDYYHIEDKMKKCNLPYSILCILKEKGEKS